MLLKSIKPIQLLMPCVILLHFMNSSNQRFYLLLKILKEIRKDINEVILLASWKDVNIDALKQSARRSHNNLYKIVRKYRAILSTPVQPIIEQGISESTNGMTSSSSSALINLPQIQIIVAGNERQIVQSIPSWIDRPKRLQNLNVIENNLKVYVDRISQEQLPNLLELALEIISDMERVRKETPSEFKNPIRN